MFKKRKETNAPVSAEKNASTDSQCMISNIPISDSKTISDNSTASTSSNTEEVDNILIQKNALDIGFYVGIKDKIDEDLKYRLLDAPWKPTKSFAFPITDEKRKLKFQMHWFEKFSWLVYTTKGQQGALCKYCVLFAGECAGKGSHQQLKSLVTQPLNRWKDAMQDFKRHNDSYYHKSCLLLADNFLKIKKICKKAS